MTKFPDKFLLLLGGDSALRKVLSRYRPVWHTEPMKTRNAVYHRHRFPPVVIQHAVWLYHRFCLGYRDIEYLLAERGIIVSYETIRRIRAIHYRPFRNDAFETWRRVAREFLCAPDILN